MNEKINIGFLLFPKVTQLDLTGPVQVLSRVPGAVIHLVHSTTDPVMTDVAGFTLNPTTTYAECPALDVLCVPGGFGVIEQIGNQEALAFLRKQGAVASYVTSVCNGSLLLGAAGLLRGYKSTCHWMWLDFLPNFGAVPVQERVVRDRNRFSGAGVTSGIDFALTLAAELAGIEVAKLIQLGLEYDPRPPFDCGSPAKAGADRVAQAHVAAQANIRRAELAIANATMPQGIPTF